MPCDHDPVVHSASFESRADCIEDQCQDDSHTPTQTLVGWNQADCSSNRTERHGSVDQADLSRVESKLSRHEQIRTTDHGLVQSEEMSAHRSEGNDHQMKCRGSLYVSANNPFFSEEA